MPRRRRRLRPILLWALFLSVLAILSAAKLHQNQRLRGDRARWEVDRAQADAAWSAAWRRIEGIPHGSDIRAAYGQIFGAASAARPDEMTAKMRASGKPAYAWRDDRWGMHIVATFNDDGSRYDSYFHPPPIIGEQPPVPPLWDAAETLRRGALRFGLLAFAGFLVMSTYVFIRLFHRRGDWPQALKRVAVPMLAVALVTTAACLTDPDLRGSHRGVYALPFMLALPLLILHLARRPAMPHDHPACQACGYNLTGNTSGTCPECGAAV